MSDGRDEGPAAANDDVEVTAAAHDQAARSTNANDHAGRTAPVVAVGPWRRSSRRLAYENPWIQVHHDEVIRPDGRPGIYGVVHFRTRAVGIVAIDDDDRVVLVGQYRYALERYSWEIPEGGAPMEEDTLEAAQRELREETGCSAASWLELGGFDLSNSVSDEAGVLYLATGLVDGPASPDGTEDLRLRRVPFDEALTMLDEGRILDAMSQLAIERVARWRANSSSGRASSSAWQDNP